MSRYFSESASNPAAWSGNRLTRRNVGRHTYYWRFPTRALAPTEARRIETEFSIRGTSGYGVHFFTLGGNLDDKLRVPNEASRAACERVWSASVPSPVLVLVVSEGVEEFSLVAADRVTSVTPSLPADDPLVQPSPSPRPLEDATPSALPPVPGGHTALSWPPSGLSGTIPPGYGDVYYYMRWGGGTMHLESTVTGTQGQVNFAPLAGGSSPYDLWTFAHTYSSPDGREHTSPVHAEDHPLAAGWYVVRVQAMTVSSSPARYTLQVR